MKSLAFVFLCLITVRLVAQQLPSDSLNEIGQGRSSSADTLTKETPKAETKQNPPKTVKRAERLTALFDSTGNILEEGEIFSKMLRVINNTEIAIFFKLNVSYPVEWKSLLNSQKIYTVQGYDTMYVPVRLVPLGKVRGNTRYVINAYLFDSLGAPLTSTYVLASRPKLTKWTLNVGPNKKIYFKNDSNEARFTINVGNEGTESQDLYMSMGNYRKDVILLDTNGKIIKRPNRSFTLREFADTTFYYGVKIFSAARNKKRTDTEGYRPGYINEARTYSIFVKTTETSLLGANARQLYQKLDFVQLPNERKLSDYGMYSLPLLMDFTLSNLFSQEPTAFLYLRGSTGLNNGGALVYSLQMIGAFGIQGGSAFPPPFFNIGYYDNKLSVMIGDVGGSSGAIGIGGKGISGSYKFNRRHRVGAFFVLNPGFLRQYTYYGTGLNYNYTGDQFSAGLGYSHIQYNTNTSVPLISDYLTSTSGFSLTSHQSISLGITLARTSETGIARNGFDLTGGYGGTFIKTRLITNIGATYFSRYFNFFDEGKRFMLNHNSSFRLNQKWSLRLADIYNQFATPAPFTNLIFYNQSSFNNILSAGRVIDINSSFGTGVFYNIFTDDYYQYTSHSRGIQFSYNYTLPEEYLLFGSSAQFGYNKVVTTLNSPDDFFINLYSILKYRVYSFMVRYNDGNANGAYFTNSSQQLYTESFSASLNHQYQFRNRHFILNNSLTYNLLPQLDRTSIGITPELNYYTKDGWRIRLTAGYYYTSSLPISNNPYQVFVPTTSTSTDNSNTPIVSDSYMLMIGVRKEFGIPLPFIKKRYPSLNFIAFVDINGNGKFDFDEARLENVVINVNGWEVLTNAKGEAQLKNMPEGEYVWQSFSLDDIQGYFPNIKDKIEVFAGDSGKPNYNNLIKAIPVPYVKGIKLFGRVYLDREKLSPDAINLLDLSGIRISVNCEGKKSSALTEKDGSFMLYLPYGKYIVSMDEKILGDHFRLMQNDIEVELNKGIENLFVSFYIVENQRKIIRKHFDANGNLIPEGAGDASGKDANDKTGKANPNAGKDLVAEANAAAAKVRPRPLYDVAKDAFLADKTDATTTKGLIYTVQLGAFQKPLNPSVFKGFKNVMYERIDNDFVRITVGNIATEAEAQAEKDNLVKVGFPAAFVSVYHDGKNISLAEAAQLKKNKTK